MALNFIKKVFSFGKKQVEEEIAGPTPDQAPVEATEAGPAPAPLTEAEAARPAPEAVAEAAPGSEAPEPTAKEAAGEPSGGRPEARTPSPADDRGEQDEAEGADAARAAVAAPVPDAVPPAAETEEPGVAHAEKEDAAKEEAAPSRATGADQGSDRAGEAERPSAQERGPREGDLEGRAESAGEPPAGTAGEVAPPDATPRTPEPGADEPSDRPAPTPPMGAEATPRAPEPGRVTVGRTAQRKAPEEEPATPAPAPDHPRTGWWQRLRSGLARSSAQLTDQVTGIFTRRKLDEDTLQDLEDVLIQADLGVETAMRITDTLAAGRYGRDVSTAEVTRVMAGEIEKVLDPVARPLELDLSHKPHIVLVVGVNGTGKTTTIGKLAAKLTAGGLKVTLAAGDTFRAAAIEQLKIWGERTGAEVVSTRLGADAAGLAYEAVERARANGSDVLIVDTAGRLQNRTELMDELAKVVRVIGKLDPDAPHTVLQTLDATTGQNALNQVEIFRNVAGVNGLVMTKLDGTARGGILVAIAARHKLPVYFIGVGEGVDDLEPFEAREFAAAIVGDTQ